MKQGIGVWCNSSTNGFGPFSSWAERDTPAII